jgi:hypothetical protein
MVDKYFGPMEINIPYASLPYLAYCLLFAPEFFAHLNLRIPDVHLTTGIPISVEEDISIGTSFRAAQNLIASARR